MRTSNSMRILAGVTIAALLAAAQAQAVIAYGNAAGSYGNVSEGGPYTLGSQFTVGSSALTVTSLGAFDNGQGGWSSTIYVAMYDLNTLLQVGSMATFNSGTTDGTLGADGGSRFLSVTPFTLNAGGSYMIVAAGYGAAGGEAAYRSDPGTSNSHLTIASGITVGYDRWSMGGSMQLPTSAELPTAPRYGAGTFEFTPVPEVEDYAVAAIGLLGLVYIGRYARNLRTQKLA